MTDKKHPSHLRKIAAEVQRALGSQYCPVRQWGETRGWFHCRRAPGHQGDHCLIVEAPMVYEMADSGIPIDKKRVVVRHKNGDRTDNRPSNLEAISRSQYQREFLSSTQNRQRRGDTWNELAQRWERECRVCGSYLPLEEFDQPRHVCRACYRARERQRSVSQYHNDAFVFLRQSYSLGMVGVDPTPAEQADGLFLLASLLKSQFLEDAGGDASLARKHWRRISSDK